MVSTTKEGGRVEDGVEKRLKERHTVGWGFKQRSTARFEVPVLNLTKGRHEEKFRYQNHNFGIREKEGEKEAEE